MAELNPPRPSAQLRAIAYARWRLVVNSVRTTRGALEMASRIWIGFWFTVLGIGGAVGFGITGWYFLHQHEPEWIAALLWPLFAFWQIFPLAASAFTEHIDSSHLARYPLSYRTYCMVRIAFGSLDVSTLAGCLCMLGLTVGCGIAAPTLLPVTVVVAAAFVLFNILLAQMIFAWLERWLAKRRTREILALLLFLAIFCTNFIGPLMRRWRHGPSGTMGWLQAVLPTTHWLPPGLPAHALATFLDGRWMTGTGAVLLLLAWAAVILGLLHIRLLAEYRGENLSEAAPATPKPPVRKAAAELAPSGARGWPGFSGPVAAIAQKELRYLLRSPMMFFSLVMPVLLLVFFRMSAMNPSHYSRPGPFHFSGASLGFPLGVAYALLILTNLIFNAFGTDAAGVQFYFVSPVRFREILMGKNLAYALILAVEVAVIYAAAAFIDGPPSMWVLAATLAGVVFAALCDFSCGNLISLYLPKKIDLGRLGRQSGRGTSGLAALAIQAVIAGLAAIAVLGATILGKPWLMVVILALLALVALVAYRLVLDQSETIAQAHRETLITELSKA